MSDAFGRTDKPQLTLVSADEIVVGDAVILGSEAHIVMDTFHNDHAFMGKMIGIMLLPPDADREDYLSIASVSMAAGKQIKVIRKRPA